MDDGKKYVVYGMRLKCSEGTMENYLSTDIGHGIVYLGQPVMNANDHEVGIHITHFGDCNSKKVFEEAKKEADEKYKAEEGDGFFAKAGKWLAKTVTKAAVEFRANFMSNKCEPVTLLPWLFTREDHAIDGAPALMMESLCPCALGGVISIVPVDEEVAQEEAEEKEKEENPEEKQNKEDFLSQLPEQLKNIIDISALKATDDGFVMCTESLANLMNKLGIVDTNISEENKEDVQSYYDDWYLYGVMDDSGDFTFSLLKMREQERDREDGDNPGVTIPFINFNVNTLVEATTNNLDALENTLASVTTNQNEKYDNNLYEYFAKTESKAPYLIVDHYIDFIAHQSQNGKIILPDNMDGAPQRVVDLLENLNRESGKKIYDPENNCLNITDKNNLTEEEKLSILVSHTANASQNSFAAEVEFHSDALKDIKQYVPILGKRWYNSALRADMGIGEEKEYGVIGSFDEYYDLNSELVKRQEEIHGKK